jgi:hypothetical protein
VKLITSKVHNWEQQPSVVYHNVDLFVGGFVLVTRSRRRDKTLNCWQFPDGSREIEVCFHELCVDSHERQDDTDQTVRTWGDTAVISAKLSEKGTDGGEPFEYTVWFSDTYVRTALGWRYVFGQSSLPLPETQ